GQLVAIRDRGDVDREYGGWPARLPLPGDPDPAPPPAGGRWGGALLDPAQPRGGRRPACWGSARSQTPAARSPRGQVRTADGAPPDADARAAGTSRLAGRRSAAVDADASSGAAAATARRAAIRRLGPP